MSLTTRKMSDRHEHDLVVLLGGERTRNSGAVWSDQSDGHQTGVDQYWTFGWDGKSTLGKSIGITRDMLTKLRDQCRGLEPMLPLRWYADERLTRVDEDWIAVEAETFAQILEDANAYRALRVDDDRHQVELRWDGWTLTHPMAERLDGDIFECDFNSAAMIAPHPAEGRFYCTVGEDGQIVIGDPVS